MSAPQETLVRAPRPGAETLAEPMRSRWSPAVFATDVPVGDEEVSSMLTAAAWAPSTGNTQPWAYVVTRAGTAAYDAVIASLSNGNAGWVPTAPVVIVAAALTGEWEGRSGMGDYALYDLGQSVAHLTLQAQAMGLHSHQFAGFELQHDVAQVDFVGRHPERQSAAATLRRMQVTVLGKRVHHLAQMFLRNAESGGYRVDRHGLIGCCDIQQHAQGIVGIAGESHEPVSWRRPSQCRPL